MTQRPCRRRSAVAAAGAGTLLGGVVVETVRTDDDIPSGPSLIPLALAAAATLVVVRRWLAGTEARIKAELHDTLSDQHHRKVDALDNREHALRRREELLADAEARQETRIKGLAQRLDEAHNDLATRNAELATLRRDYIEVSADHDRIVEAFLVQGFARFTGSAEGTFRPRAPECEARPHEEHDPTPVTQLQPREHQESV